jgi:glycolate oxidase
MTQAVKNDYDMKIVGALEKIVGTARVSTSESVCLSYAFNCYYGKDIVVKPDIIVMAETVEQVSKIVKAANQYKVPITPKGAVGGAGHGGALKGGILLDLVLMDRILSVDAINMKTVAEAGCSFFKLSQELFKNGLMLPTAAYGPGPNVAASALTPATAYGGNRYGPNINLVEGFEVVLPSGEVIRVGSMAYADSEFGPYFRYITGPDLVGLFTKANGAFGIVTKIAYQCLHRPKHWAFHSYYWPLEKIGDLTKALMETTAAEVFDAHIVNRMRLGREPLPDGCDLVLLFTTNGDNAQQLNGNEQNIDDICKAHGGTYLPEVAKKFHTILPGSFFPPGNLPPPDLTQPVKRPRMYLYIFDELMFPSSWLPTIYTKILEVFKKHGLEMVPTGADGFVLHGQTISWQTTVFIDDGNRDLVERYHKCQDEFREWFLGKGGTYQLRLPPHVPDSVWTNQLGAFNLLKGIKSFLDPNNILSPGTFELWQVSK